MKNWLIRNRKKMLGISVIFSIGLALIPAAMILYENWYIDTVYSTVRKPRLFYLHDENNTKYIAESAGGIFITEQILIERSSGFYSWESIRLNVTLRIFNQTGVINYSDYHAWIELSNDFMYSCELIKIDLLPDTSAVLVFQVIISTKRLGTRLWLPYPPTIAYDVDYSLLIALILLGLVSTLVFTSLSIVLFIKEKQELR